MKFSWTRNGMELSASVTQPHGNAATQAEVDHALTVLRAVHSGLVNQTSDGLELRVLAALQAQSGRGRVAAGWQTMQSVCARGWAPAAVAAALLCVFTGGIFVAHETSLAFRTPQEVLAGSPGRPGAVPVSGSPLMRDTDAAAGTKTLATASARSKPATPIYAGHRRGRATAIGTHNSR
jgi:hypothetical protein